jgi:hypothetical protein
MSEPTKVLLFFLAIIFLPMIGYVLFLYLKERYEMKNVIHVDFKKEKGKKAKGYVKNKKETWQHDDTLYLEDEGDVNDDD